MAAGIFLFTFLCGLTYSSGQWRGLQPSSENGFNDLFSAIRPVTLSITKNDDKVKMTVKYRPGVTTVPFWNIKLSDQQDLTYTLGKLSRDGETEVSSIEFNASATVSDLNVHISSNIGELVLEINYGTFQNHIEVIIPLKVDDKEAFKDDIEEIEVPDMGVTPLVPSVFNPLSPDLSCTEQFILVKFERDNTTVSLESGRDVDFTYVDEYLDLETDDRYIYHHYLEKDHDFYGMEIELKPRYILNGSEVQAQFKTYGELGDEMKQYFKSVSKIVHSVIRPPHPVHYVMFHEDLGVFRETEQTIDIPADMEDLAISCAAFGVPKPKIEISDENGNVMSATEVTLSNGMTSHVIAPMIKIARHKVAGKYKCVAKSGDATKEQTVTLKDSKTN